MDSPPESQAVTEENESDSRLARLDRRTLLGGLVATGSLVAGAGTASAGGSEDAKETNCNSKAKEKNGSTEITDCRTISDPGTYTLENDIESDQDVCLRITANNVTLDGQGHTISAPDDFGDDRIGILVTGNRVEVRDVTVLRWGTGIQFQKSVASSIVDCTVENSPAAGIRFVDATRNLIAETSSYGESTGVTLNSSHRNTLRDSEFTADTAGVRLDESDGNVFTRNEVDGTDLGFVVDSSDRNAFVQNIVPGQDDGFLLFDGSDFNLLSENEVPNPSDIGIVIANSKRNELSGNVITDGDNEGVLLSDSDRNSLTENVIRRNRIGLRLDDSDNNLVEDNEICDNSEEQIQTDADSTDNRFVDNDQTC